MGYRATTDAAPAWSAGSAAVAALEGQAQALKRTTSGWRNLRRDQPQAVESRLFMHKPL